MTSDDADIHVGATASFTLELVEEDGTARDLTGLLSASVRFQRPDGTFSAVVALTLPTDRTTGIVTGTLTGAEFTETGWHRAQVLETWPAPEGAVPTRAVPFRVGPNFHAAP